MSSRSSCGRKCTNATKTADTANSWRGRYTFRTSAALPTIDVVAFLKASLKRLMPMIPEKRYTA